MLAPRCSTTATRPRPHTHKEVACGCGGLPPPPLVVKKSFSFHGTPPSHILKHTHPYFIGIQAILSSSHSGAITPPPFSSTSHFVQYSVQTSTEAWNWGKAEKDRKTKRPRERVREFQTKWKTCLMQMMQRSGWLCVCVHFFVKKNLGLKKKLVKNFIVDISQVDGERVNF